MIGRMFGRAKQPGAIESEAPPVEGRADDDEAVSGLTAVILRNDWYKDRYTTVLRSLAVIAIIAAVQAVTIIVLALNKPDPKYFAVDGQGLVVEIVPVDRPLLGNDALAQWASDTARRAYNIDFVNWQQQLGALKDRFSAQAYDSYVAQMDSSGNLRGIRENRMVMEAITEPAVITRTGIDNGRYTWDVEVPVSVVTHYGGASKRTQRVRVSMTITRVDNRLRPESGVVVTRLVTALG